MTETATMPRPPKRNDVPIKVDADVARLGRIIAASKNITLAELTSEALRPIWLKEIAKIKDGLPGGKPRDEK